MPSLQRNEPREVTERNLEFEADRGTSPSVEAIAKVGMIG